MWCTRWFLPLLFLPVPNASAYFLVLLLFSLVLHARPCFYCIILLTALFLSSCYWQPIPIDTPLSIPWSENITTFSDALNASLTIPLESLKTYPTLLRPTERCWCDFTTGSIFEPFNVGRWERASVERLRDELENEMKQEEEEVQEENVQVDENAEQAEEPQTLSISLSQDNFSVEVASDGLSGFSIFRAIFGGEYRSSPPTETPNLFTSETSNVSTSKPLEEVPKTSESSLEHVGADGSRTHPAVFDLRPYGFDLLLDFRWQRQS